MALQDRNVVQCPDVECKRGCTDLPVEEIRLDDLSVDADLELFRNLTGKRNAERVIACPERPPRAFGILRGCFLDVIGREKNEAHPERPEAGNILYKPRE